MEEQPQDDVQRNQQRKYKIRIRKGKLEPLLIFAESAAKRKS